MIIKEMEGIVLVTKLDLNDKKTQSRLRDWCTHRYIYTC